MNESENYGLKEQAHQLSTLAINFNHPILPAQGRAVIHESARLIHAMAERLETLEQKVATYEQTAQR